jgi:hypothetical protein
LYNDSQSAGCVIDSHQHVQWSAHLHRDVALKLYSRARSVTHIRASGFWTFLFLAFSILLLLLLLR